MEFKELFIYTKGDIVLENNSISIAISGEHNAENKVYDTYYDKLDIQGCSRNWNAFLDILRDLDWVKEEYVYIIHSGIPGLDQENFQIYIEVLYDALCTRAIGGFKAGPELVVIFKQKDRETINIILSNYVKEMQSSAYYEPHPLGYY